MVPALPVAAMGVRTLATMAWKALSSNGSKLITASVPTLQRIATRVGSQADSASILSAIKNNKLMTAYVLYELYGAADATLQAMREADEEVARVVDLFGFTPDEPGPTATGDLTKMHEEFDILARAIRTIGSFERLLTLKKALTLSDATFMQYRVVRDMGKALS